MNSSRSSLSAVLVLSVTINPVWSQGPGGSYYPIAVGNIWKYEVRESSEQVRYVTWRVTTVQKHASRIVYQLLPKPLENDDDVVFLRLERGRVVDDTTSQLIVAEGLRVGSSWEMKDNGISVRRYRVLNSGQPCVSGLYKSTDCLTIEDTDARLHLRSVTMYARGIGSLRFEYFDTKSRSSKPLSTVELVAHTGAK